MMIIFNSPQNVSFKHVFLVFALMALPSQLLAEKYTRDDLIQYMLDETNLSKAYVSKYIKFATFDADLIRKMNTPYEARPYADYRPLFVNKRLKKRSQDYLAQHKDIFAAAHAKYGVAPEIVASILGIETRFGQNWGRDKVLDALFTLSTGYERRAKFFRNELKEFLLLCEEEGLNPQEVDGSYAGAFGVTQFIPSSFRAYAVDANDDGKRDVWHSPQDIIFSVANYFKRHKWTDNKMVAHWINDLPSNAFIKQALKDETRKYRAMHEFEEAGIKKPKGWSSDEKVALIERETKDGVRPLLVSRNFHAITRWNRSWNYALAVTELAYSLGNQQCEIGS
ncbi:MAG TPA: lytic murein transglycosylase [Ghiorsea sp.]|nr:lytic murein transglycosylase [Ghiorsea sp.]HIP07594.1 lytic murein transglycosylase [Mariprofundaceae bacterium]